MDNCELNDMDASRPTARSTLVFGALEHDGTIIVYEPSVRCSYRLGKTETAVFCLFDGSRTRLDVLARCAEKGIRIDAETLDRFIVRLHAIHLLCADPHEGVVQQVTDSEAHSHVRGMLFILRFRDSSRWINRTAALSRGVLFFLFCIGAILTITAIQVAAVRFDELAFDLRHLARAWVIVAMLCLHPIVMLAHEFSHVLACWRLGVKVTGIGLTVRNLLPEFYTDMVAVWMLRRTADRLWVVGIGPLFQIIAAASCLLVWSWAPEHSFVSHVGLGTFLGAMLGLLLCLNPFVQSDGRYILMIVSDWLRSGRRSSQRPSRLPSLIDTGEHE